MPFSCLAKRAEVTEPIGQHRLAAIPLFSLPLDGWGAAAHWGGVQTLPLKENVGGWGGGGVNLKKEKGQT